MAKPTRPRTPKTKRSAPGAAALASLGHNLAGPLERSAAQLQEAFLQHRKKWNEAMSAKALTDKQLRSVKAALKAEGFTVQQMKVADDLESISGEDKLTVLIETILKVAVWQNHPLGRQLDMFHKPNEVVKDRATRRAAGRLASMNDEPRKPPHAPGTLEYDEWMNGYAEHQSELASRFKPTKRKRAKKADEHAEATA